jgi:cytoskeleton protein RodZ
MAMDIGAELRAAREAKGISLGTLSQRIRVQARTLAAIELNDVSRLPPRPFGRGFVKAYAEEVDLDPDRTVQTFFSQFPARPPVPSSTRREIAETVWQTPSNLAGLAVAATILILVVAAAMVLGGRRESPENSAVGTTGSTAPAPAPASATAAPAPEPAPATIPTAPAAPLHFAFVVNRPCWVTAHTDGQRAIYRIVYPNDPQTLNAQRDIVIRFGDAGAVTWSINGRTGAALGGHGAIRDVRITPENAATLH